MVTGVTSNINGTIISYFPIMLGGILWKDMTVSGSDIWYSYTWSPVIVLILDKKPFWTYQSINWDIIVNGKFVVSSLPSHIWHLNLGVNAIDMFHN